MKTGVEDPAWLRVIELTTMSCVPMAIKAAINLNIINILASQQDGTHLSASQIVARMTSEPKPAPSSIDRILRLLASHGVLSSSTHSDDIRSNGNASAHLVRAYGLNSVSKYLVPNQKSGASLSPFLCLHQDPVFIKTLFHMEEALLDGGEPFMKAHGKSSFVYNQEDARFNNLFNLAMSDYSKLLMASLVDVYHGFEGLKSLVDVGGGLGTTIRMIVSKHPHIQGINFDMPHVIAVAPEYPGVHHVAGDMFVSIPQADAIFMKWILHDWSDEHCLKILRNCYGALPSKGKVIVVDAVLPIEVDNGPKTRIGHQLDVLMFSYNSGGRERTREEFEALATSVGFSHLEVICQMQESTILEIHKS